MQRRRVLLTAAALFSSAGLFPQTRSADAEQIMSNQENHAYNGPYLGPYLGMWVTGDGRIRHELLPSGRYDEARGSRKSAYQGSYVITGDHIDYWDDTGFTADGDFVDGVLHHGGMLFYRE